MLDEKLKLTKELDMLKKEHDDLDQILSDLIGVDQISAQRLKKRKLWIKDKISLIEAVLYPDIIA